MTVSDSNRIEYARVACARTRLEVALAQVNAARGEIAATVGVDHQTSRGLVALETDVRVSIGRVDMLLRRIP